jgi:phage terminase large subunit
MNDHHIDRDEWIIADSAEPKSIAELHALGWKIEGANKGPDSVKNGIDILKRYRLNLVGDCAPLIRELNAYKWKVDRISGNTLNEPVDAFNHALDSLRYLALNRLVNNGYGEYVIM